MKITLETNPSDADKSNGSLYLTIKDADTALLERLTRSISRVLGESIVLPDE